MFGLGLGEWALILGAAVLLFGPKYIGKLGKKMLNNVRSVGQEFKEGYEEGNSTATSASTESKSAIEEKH
ncbi:TPA: twin-arginine translocase TatA/TatE family subunit [bacterium UBP9_UBA11836]|nr:twin-arginine translocase TatA/TatE family subunit [bacterium UBP9_UBA11836]